MRGRGRGDAPKPQHVMQLAVAAHLPGSLAGGPVVLGQELLVKFGWQHAEDLYRVVRVTVVSRLRGHADNRTGPVSQRSRPARCPADRSVPVAPLAERLRPLPAVAESGALPCRAPSLLWLPRTPWRFPRACGERPATPGRQEAADPLG